MSEKKKIERDYYKVLILSQSGKGKTFSARNLDPETTGFINAENKPLPFKNSFKYHAKPKRHTGVMQALKDYAANDDIKCIFIDSFSAYSELLLEEMRQNFKGFDVWTNYNTRIGEFLREIKNTNKEIFVTGHYEIINIEGEPEKRCKTKGREWDGIIEKEFTVVLYGEGVFKDDKADYFFRTMGEGLSAKCPPELLDNKVKVPNDCQQILEKIYEFTGVK